MFSFCSVSNKEFTSKQIKEYAINYNIKINIEYMKPINIYIHDKNLSMVLKS